MPSVDVLPISPMPSSMVYAGSSNALLNRTDQRIEDGWQEVTLESDFALFSIQEFERATDHLAEQLIDIKKKFEALESGFSKIALSPEEITKYQEYLNRQGSYISQCLYIVREMASNPDALEDPNFQALIKPGADNEIAVLRGLKQELQAFMREVGTKPVKPSHKKINEGLTIGLPVASAVGIAFDSALLGGILTTAISMIKCAIFIISGKERKKTECKELIRDVSQSLINFLDERMDMPDHIGQTTAATYLRTANIDKNTQDIASKQLEIREDIAAQGASTENAINNAAGALTSLEIRLLEENKQLKEQNEKLLAAQANMEKNNQERFEKMMAVLTARG